jgi:fatty-acyl-CoA synthase
MSHASGAVTSFAAINGGGCLVIQRDFNPAEVVRTLSEGAIARTSLVAAMIQACLVAVPDAAACAYPSLRLIAYGASPIAEPTLRRAMATFKCDFVEAYGMTETSAVLTYLLPADHRRALESQPGLLLSAGRPVAGTELRIVDEQDRPVPCGTIGEIVARGPQLMLGYWNRPEESAEALRGGWMHTGDAGVLDDEGYVYVSGRARWTSSRRCRATPPARCSSASCARSTGPATPAGWPAPRPLSRGRRHESRDEVRQER